MTSLTNRLTNQLWKLIPMREHSEDWVGQLDTVLLELSGLADVREVQDEKYTILLSKLNGLRKVDTDFLIYRKTVFKCISLLRELRL